MHLYIFIFLQKKSVTKRCQSVRKNFFMQNRSFLFGMLVGCFIGLSMGLLINFNWVFLHRIGNWFEKSFSNLYNKVIQMVRNDFEHKQIYSGKKDTVIITAFESSKNRKIKDDFAKKDTVFILIDSLAEAVHKSMNFNIDSQTINNKGFNNVVIEKNIIVAKDELLTTKKIIIDGYNPNPAGSSYYDSLLTQNYSKSSSEFIVEFWVSPIKYKGYRINKNKIVLYGIYQYDSVFFMAKDDKLYMNYQNQYYYLENSSDFNSFKPLKDLKVISQIKRK